MSSKPDDLEAVRLVADTLKQFDGVDQERIIRWVREKLGLLESGNTSSETKSRDQSNKDNEAGKNVDIKGFVTQKNPSSDNQLAATIAYYYAFVAPEGQRKESISSDDLRQACRLIYGTSRLKKPAQTLINAHNAGLLDKGGDHGAYRVNTVGENLVAMTLPSASAVTRPTKKRLAGRNKKRAKGRK